MTSYLLVERHLHTDQALTIWDQADGHPMTASQASNLLIEVRAKRADLRHPHADTFLEVVPAGGDR